jgi:hypothetical protein
MLICKHVNETLTGLTYVTATESDKWEEPAVDENMPQEF